MSRSISVPAAEYLRTSKLFQETYLDHQKAVIREYAGTHGFKIVETYSDLGRSGVVLKRRPGLQRLIRDVVSGNNTYATVLVYDISRWGRFQNPDEAAHYEFLCKDAGVNVLYCNEAFPNDGTAVNTILKNLRRSLAGEFSRELSEKVFQAQKRLILHGFRMGGAAGYGLRRLMISPKGQPLQTLVRGEWKCDKTNRTILVPGPQHEVELVKEIFSMADAKGLKCGDIARELNKRRILFATGKPWDYFDIERMLKNPKYTGCNAWGRTSQKLRRACRMVSPENWITKPDAFDPIIPRDTFDRVQALLKERTSRKWTDRELLTRLKKLLAKKGKLSQAIIDGAPRLPSSATFYAHFGPLRRLYRLIGYHPPKGVFSKIHRRDQTEMLRLRLFSQIRALFPADISVFHQKNRRRSILRLDNGLSISVVICRCRRLPTGKLAWKLYPTPTERNYITLLCRLNSKNDGFHDFYLFSSIDKHSWFSFTSRSEWLRKAIRLTRIADFYETAKQVWRDHTEHGGTSRRNGSWPGAVLPWK